MARSLLMILLVGFAISQDNQERGWQGIIPLASTRTDVEKLLGQPMSGEKGYVLTYDTQNERVTVWYGGAKPSTLEPCKWNVTSDTVIRFIVGPKGNSSLAEAGLDLTKYKRTVDWKLRDFFYYVSENEGRMIETKLEDGVEVIVGYKFQPTPAEKKAKCY